MATQEEVARHIYVSESALQNLPKLAGSPKPRGLRDMMWTHGICFTSMF
ncbi:terminase [Buttiauxella sp. 3AFRM03]|nr:terminase [Buttiauxella sp. 3AFRM03]